MRQQDSARGKSSFNRGDRMRRQSQRARMSVQVEQQALKALFFIDTAEAPTFQAHQAYQIIRARTLIVETTIDIAPFERNQVHRARSMQCRKAVADEHRLLLAYPHGIAADTHMCQQS